MATLKNLSCIAAGCLALAATTPSHAITVVYQAALSGPNESPANASAGVGLGIITIDDVLNTMHVQVTFSGLTGTTTASHIHAATPTAFSGTAGVATTTPTFAGFPLGVTSGSYDITLDLTASSSWNPAYVTANGGTTASAETAFLSAVSSGRSYLNIHTSSFPGGEIRGFLTPVPEASTSAMLLGGLALMGLLARRRRVV